MCRIVSQSIVVCPLLSLPGPAYVLLPPHWFVCAWDRVDAHIILECDAWADVLKHHWWSSSITVTKSWCVLLYSGFINQVGAHFSLVTNILFFQSQLLLYSTKCVGRLVMTTINHDQTRWWSTFWGRRWREQYAVWILINHITWIWNFINTPRIYYFHSHLDKELISFIMSPAWDVAFFYPQWARQMRVSCVNQLEKWNNKDFWGLTWGLIRCRVRMKELDTLDVNGGLLLLKGHQERAVNSGALPETSVKIADHGSPCGLTMRACWKPQSVSQWVFCQWESPAVTSLIGMKNKGYVTETFNFFFCFILFPSPTGAAFIIILALLDKWCFSLADGQISVNCASCTAG